MSHLRCLATRFAPRYFRSFPRPIPSVFDDFLTALSFWRPMEPSRTSPTEARPTPSLWSPRCDVIEKDGAVHITADVPGLQRDDLVVEYDDKDHVLTVKGEVKHENVREQNNMQLSERRFGSFIRQFQLDEAAETDRIRASMKDGVLNVTVPTKPREPEPTTVRKIEVEK